MEQLPVDYAGIGSDEENLVFAPLRRLRQATCEPLAALLAHLGISPDMLSFASVIAGIGFCVFAPFQLSVAFWCLIGALVCDSLDGVLARFTKTATVGGAFTDMFCDQFLLALCAAGLAWKGIVHPALILIFIYVHTTMGIFMLLHRLLGVSTRLLLRPGKSFFCIAFILYFFSHVNLLNYLLGFYLLTLPLLGVSFWRLKKALGNLQHTTKIGK